MSAPPGKLTFKINRKLLTDVLLVSDSDVRDAIRFAFNYLKLVIEPGGAAALAAILNGSINTKDKTTVAILTGGNIDPLLHSSIICDHETV